MMGGRGSGSGCSRNRTQEFFSAVGSLENTYVTHRQPLLQNGATNKHGQLAKRYHQNSSSHNLCQNQSVEASVLWIIKYLWNRCYTTFMVWPNPLLADFGTYHVYRKVVLCNRKPKILRIIFHQARPYSHPELRQGPRLDSLWSERQRKAQRS